MNEFLRKIFLKKDLIKKVNTPENDLMLRLMIEIAISDGNLDKQELKLMEEKAKKVTPKNKKISLTIKKIIDENNRSTSFYPTVKKINEMYSINEKKELLQDLWELVAADSFIDPNEESLFFRIAELIKIKRSAANQIKHQAS